MSTYLVLKERAKAFRADPEVQAAMRHPGHRAGRADARRGRDGRRPAGRRGAFEDFDAEGVAEAAYAFVALNQLAVEHALGGR